MTTMPLSIRLAALAAAFAALALLGHAADAQGSADDAIVAKTLSAQSGAALDDVRSVRAQSAMTSSLSDAELDSRLAKLLKWVVASYAQSGSLHLLPDAPDARNARGMSNTRLETLRETYWLQDNGLYGAGALAEYVPALGKSLADSWRTKWQQTFPRLCPDTQSGYAVGILPSYDGAGAVSDPRCRLPRPDTWEYFHMFQYPRPADPSFDSLPRPIIGTDHPSGTSGETRFVPIRQDAVRDLLKYGCLRQAMLGDVATAKQMFGLALAQWDGNGFKNPRKAAKLSGIYWTRDLAFALLCANATGEGAAATWSQGVTKAAIEQKLWASQSDSGGIWTNYCVGADCTDGFIPGVAKQTNEIAPLVLLAYGPNIWRRTR